MKSWLLALLLLPSMASAGGNVVGNNGDGFLLDGKIHLRDLVEAGAHRNPWIGPANQLGKSRQAVTQALGSLFWDSTPVQRKLTDINLAFPGFGDILVGVIASYNWRFVETTDVLPSQRAPALPQVWESRRVQIAIRQNGIVKIIPASWARMSDADRAALVIHEAAMSLLRPFCMGRNRCIQRQTDARIYIGRLFDHDLMNADHRFADREEIRQAFLKHFNFPIHSLSSAVRLTADDSGVTTIINVQAPQEDIRAFCNARHPKRHAGVRAEVYHVPMNIERKTYVQALSEGVLDYRIIRQSPRPNTPSIVSMTADFRALDQCIAGLTAKIADIRAAQIPLIGRPLDSFSEVIDEENQP